MDESFQDLESELKSLPPRAPSPLLVERLAAELSARQENPPAMRPRYTTATNLGSWKWFGWRPAGLAAAVALVAFIGGRSFLRPPEPTAGGSSAGWAVTTPAPTRSESVPVTLRNHYQPVAATNVLYDLQDEGLVKDGGDTPTRRVRARYLDTYTWKNPATNASIKWSVPRDEVRFVSANLN